MNRAKPFKHNAYFSLYGSLKMASFSDPDAPADDENASIGRQIEQAMVLFKSVVALASVPIR